MSISLPARLVIAAIKAYKWLLSPLFTGSCRYLPSCSEYMAEAVGKHGAVTGMALGVGRICRCQPFGGSGLDPVPLNNPVREWLRKRNHSRTAFAPETTPGVISTDPRNHSGSGCLIDHARREA